MYEKQFRIFIMLKMMDRTWREPVFRPWKRWPFPRVCWWKKIVISIRDISTLCDSLLASQFMSRNWQVDLEDHGYHFASVWISFAVLAVMTARETVSMSSLSTYRMDLCIQVLKTTSADKAESPARIAVNSGLWVNEAFLKPHARTSPGLRRLDELEIF